MEPFIEVGDLATVLTDDRTDVFYQSRVGDIGIVTYVGPYDGDVISLKFDDGTVIAYWPNEVELRLKKKE